CSSSKSFASEATQWRSRAARISWSSISDLLTIAVDIEPLPCAGLEQAVQIAGDFFGLTGNQAVTYIGNQIVACCEHERGRRVSRSGRRKPPAVAGSAAPEERPDARRSLRGARHDTPGRCQAFDDSRGGQSRLLEAAGPRKAALHQSRSDQRNRGALDSEIRTPPPHRAVCAEEEAGRRKP